MSIISFIRNLFNCITVIKPFFVNYSDGSQEWYLNGKFHREDGPAIIRPDGSQFWYLNGRLHREDGPAIIYSNGTVLYFKHGQSFVKHFILLNPIKFTIKDGL